MNKLIKNALAVITVGIIAATGLTTGSFAANDTEPLTESMSISYEAGISKPSYSIKGAAGSRSIKLTCKTSGATIYYTTDGTTPTKNSKKYTGLIKITKKTKINAIAISGSSVSAVMTKTVNVATLVGDITGDGKINDNDYTRLKKYLNGTTSYICKDNSDTSGDGSIKNKDLTLLKQYLNEEIDKFPAASAVTMPTATVYKTYGGKKFVLACEDSSATIYYTTNGNTPTKSSTKYTGYFIVDEDTTVKCVAYKNGSYSKVKTRTVTVDDCAVVSADKSTATQYEDKVEVKLTCGTASSKIYYTLNGSDPKTYGKYYSYPITLTEDTTIKAYSRAKGCADSQVQTFTYKVKSTGYTISGYVWNDTITESSISDGVRQNNETGINGVTVYLMNVSTGVYEMTTTTKTVNSVDGVYTFNNVPKTNTYKVVFMYNGQKYRACDNTVLNGNQAISTAVPNLMIDKYGATNTATNVQTTTINSYSAAVASASYNSYATTTQTYNNTASNVSLALKSNVYGNISLSLVPSAAISASTNKTTYLTGLTGQSVAPGDTLVYVLTLTNNSSTQTLSDARIQLYLNSQLEIKRIESSTNYINYGYVVSSGTYSVYKISDFIYTPIAPKGSITFTITTKVMSNAATGSSIINCAEITAYRYSSSCYDAYSVPGNMYVGTKRENDEAVSTAILVNGISAIKTLAWQTQPNFTNLSLAQNGVFNATILVGNSANATNSVISLSSSNLNCAECTITGSQVIGTDTLFTLQVRPKNIGTTNITIALIDDPTKSITTPVNVIA